MLIWHGLLTDTEWPGNGKIDLEVELWGSQKRSPFTRLTALQFDCFANPQLIPIPALQGPCMRLCVAGATIPGSTHSMDEEVSRQIKFWSELAASQIAMVVTLALGEDPQRRSFNQLLIFSVMEASTAAIYARPLDLNYKETLDRQFGKTTGGSARLTGESMHCSGSRTPSIAGTASKQTSKVVPPLVPRQSSDSHSPPLQAVGIPPRVPQSGPSGLALFPQPEPITRRKQSDANTKHVDRSARAAPALHHVIWSALRLRGYKRDQPNCKQIYQLCCRAAEVAFRSRPEPLPLEVMQEKVDAILNVLEI